MGLVTAVFVGLALLILAIVAVTAGTRASDKSAVRARGGPLSIFVASLAYAVVLAPVIAPEGFNLPSMVLFIVVVALPATVSGLFKRARARMGADGQRVLSLVGAIAAIALLVGVLGSAGAVL